MTSFSAIPPTDKVRLIRALVEQRTKEVFFGRLFFDGKSVGDEVILGTPEATIVTIVETYYSLLASGFSAAEVLAQIEHHRSTVILGLMPNCTELEDYVNYRVRLEHKRGRQISDHDIGRATFITGEFIAQFCQSAPEPVEAPPPVTEGNPDFHIISELPHPDFSRPKDDYKAGDLRFMYYENPRTIGSVVTGNEPAYRCAHALVVLDEDQQPLMIIRSEENALGSIFVCSLDFKGGHENWGRIATRGRDEFLKRAGEVILEMKSGKSA